MSLNSSKVAPEAEVEEEPEPAAKKEPESTPELQKPAGPRPD